MRNIIIASLVVVVSSACASAARKDADEHWAPECRALGCIEQGLALADMPVGAELRFSICVGPGMHAYQYELGSSGWVLKSMRSEVSDLCPAEKGSD